MKAKLTYVGLLVAMFGFMGCDKVDDDDFNVDLKKTFTVRVENVSAMSLLQTDRANGTVPLSPGVYAVYDSNGNPIFTVGQPADEGIERIAEDGFPMMKAQELKSFSDVISGTFESPGGPDDGPALFAGESAMFTFKAAPGDKLQLATMFVQSNDFFYAFGNEGLDLFNGFIPVSGDVTSHIVLYDAGTEEDTAPGTGPYQKPVQDPQATDVGPADGINAIHVAKQRHPAFNIPAANAVIRVTISSK